MNQKIKILLVETFLLLFFFTAFSQKVFQVNLKFPSGLNTNKVKIFYNTGKEWKKRRGAFVDNEVTISDSFYSRFATVSCTYYCDEKESSFSNSFFVSDNPATIIFYENKDTLINPFSNYQLTNACDIDKTEEAKQLALFTSFQSNNYDNFLKNFGNKINENDSLNKISQIKYNRLLNKEIEFIRHNGSLYYSLWLFKNKFLVTSNFLTADSLLKIFNLTFTEELKNTFEGQLVESTLRGRINIANDSYADFKSVDIENKIVDLKNFKGKYVLLNFWASWCAPCVAEFTTIKKLNNEYGKNKLVVISISIDQDKQKFMQAVKKYKMSWINIFHDIEIERIFLNKSAAIPQVYLIDPDSKLLYSREEEKDYDLHKLIMILKERK